jgi:hypothetical protein
MHHADLARVSVVLAAIGPASHAMAHGEGDIGLLLSGDSIVTAVADDLAGTFADIGERVFAGEIDFVSNIGDAPGFFTTDGAGLPGGFSAFSPGTTIGYRTNGAILAWDGSTFGSTTNRLRQIVIPNIIEVLSPTDQSVVDGFEYLYNGGEFDEHPDYAMLDATAAGIYLWKIAFFANDPFGATIASSDEVWVVFNFGLDEEDHELALEWAEANVPTPGALAPLTMAGLIASRRRR